MDELISNYSWRGISGSNKLAFANLKNTRRLFYKVFALADRSCSYIEVDSWLQNRAIKHCSQRIRRKISMNARKKSALKDELPDILWE